MSVATFRRVVELDANGYPLRHEEARDRAVQELRDWVNELPESVYFLNRQDAEWIGNTMLQVYWSVLTRGSK